MRVRSSPVVKGIAAFFSVLLLLASVLSVTLWIVADTEDFSTSSYAYLEEDVLCLLVRDRLRDVFATYRRGDDPQTVYSETNLIFEIRDATGNLLARSERDMPDTGGYTLECREWVDVNYREDWPEEVTESIESTAVTTVPELVAVDTTTAPPEDSGTVRQVYAHFLRGMVDREFPYADRFSILLPLFQLYYSISGYLPVIAFAAIALWLLSLTVLLRCAGWRKGASEVQQGIFERIPYDLLLAALICFGALHSILGEFSIPVRVWGLLAFAIVDAILLTWFFCTTAIRLKTRTLLKTTLIWYVLLFCWRMVCALARGCGKVCRVVVGAMKTAFSSIPLVWKTALLVIANLVVDFFAVMTLYDAEMIAVFCIVKNLILGVLILFCAVLMRRIQAGGERLAAGDLDTKIDTGCMFGDYRDFAEHLNRVGDGMAVAVEERLKSERFRTELITNVSHDIKTPLTSIVNYVDLMEKENITDEPMQGYIQVLARHAARLKKLTEDLVEASKAATGNIAVTLESLDVSMMLSQTAGEYDEKLRSVDLDLILRQPPEPIFIIADGRLLWRVFDNLMNNIVKYAMPGTRVYLSLHETGNGAEIIFRNIARDELNIPVEELTERFTRGDASRSSEGSGLGLSIANSLTVLQGGTLTLHVDGDLFKAVLWFPLA